MNVPFNAHDVFCSRCSARPGRYCRRPNGTPRMGYCRARRREFFAIRDAMKEAARG